MKKYLVVLLVLTIAASSVFAGISGYVDAKYQIDFDNGNFGYTKPQDKLKASIKFDDHIGKKNGEGKVYIDAAASFAWNSKEKNKEDDGQRFAIDQLGYFKLSLDKLMIVGQNWTLNLKEAEKLGGYAASGLDFHTWYRNDHSKAKLGGLVREDGLSTWIENPEDPYADDIIVTMKDDFKDYQKKVAYSVKDAYEYYNDDDEDAGLNGVTFQWKGYKLALALNGHVGNKDYDQKAQNFYMAVESKEFAPVDGLKFQAAAGASYRDSGWKYDRAFDLEDPYSVLKSVNFIQTKHSNIWTVGASLKANYKADKFNVDFATDHVLKTVDKGYYGGDGDPEYSGATKLKAQLAPVNVEIFFSNRAVSNKGTDSEYELFGGYGKNDEDAIKKVKKYYFSTQGLYKQNTVENLLSAELGFDLSKVWDKVPVSVRVQGLNLISDYRILSAFVDVKLLDGDLKLQVYGKDLLASFDKVNGKVAADGSRIVGEYKGEYKAEDFGSWAYWDENGDKQKIGLTANYKINDAISTKGEVFMKAGDTKIGGSVGATYKADLFTAEGSLATELDYYGENNIIEYKDHRNKGKMQAKASITSDKIVDGAILSLVYESGNILSTGNDYDWFIGQEAGKLTAKCRVNF